MSEDPRRPMDPLALLLHTAARRYLRERHDAWADRYTELRRGRGPQIPYRYTDKDLATFPRYIVLDAICTEVERIRPSTVATLDEMRSLVVLAGEVGESPFTRDPLSPIAAEVMDEERELFASHIQALDEDLLWRVAPLPSNVVLSPDEAKRVADEIAKAWEIDGYWYPLARCRRSDVRAFHRDAFVRDDASAHLRPLLPDEPVWLWGEDGTVIEMERADFDVARASSETFFASPSNTWLVYCSHEGTVAVAGVVLDALLAAWPGARAATW